MIGFQIIIEGNWAHFKKPETNNNPLTHDFITKTAFVGLIGAVLGIEREEMRPLFPQLCEDFLYGVQTINPVKKESWGFTMRKAVNLLDKAPKYMEFLKSPKYRVSVALEKIRSENYFQSFLYAVKNNNAKFVPVLGLHNCPANLYFGSEGNFSEKQNGSFSTKSFASRKHVLKLQPTSRFRIGLDRIPTLQNNDFWNLPEKYVEVIYPENGEIQLTGDFYEYNNGEKWWLI